MLNCDLVLDNGDYEKYFGVMCKEVGNPGCVCSQGASTAFCENGGLDCRGLILRNGQAESVGKGSFRVDMQVRWAAVTNSKYIQLYW